MNGNCVMEDFDRLEETLGYRFKNRGLLRQALTHASFSADLHKNYERLEFLGDRVLGLAMAHLLYNGFPDEPEGFLSPRHTRLVCGDTVAGVALELGLDKYLYVENNALRHNKSVLCDVAEAVVGAICIDSGIDEAIAFVDRNWEHFINYEAKPVIDSKTRLQELAHRMKFENPLYNIVEKTGSEHSPMFRAEAVITGCDFAEGWGKNKKEAEQAAAAALLEKLQRRDETGKQP